MKKENILLTGATGIMGQETLKQLLPYRSKFGIIVFALPTKYDRKLLGKYRKYREVSILWGNLTDYKSVKSAVEKATIVLHMGALVSPKADKNPSLTWKVNVEGTQNIVNAILEREDPGQVKLVFIGSVAQTGNRPPPYHWGRIGDPMLPSPFDHYALSKIAAERYVIESDLKYWVSLRQTGILHDNIFKVNDGIAYHQPLNNHLEWITARDSGRMMVNICKKTLPESFWGKVYNVGGGASCRYTAYKFSEKIYRMIGVSIRDIEETNWYTTRNFHGQFFYDSEKLNNYLSFREESVEDMLIDIKKKLPVSYALVKYLPKNWFKEKIMRQKASSENCPLYWIENNVDGKIKAFFGSREKWKSIQGWEKFELVDNPDHKKLDHGYDEGKKWQELDLADMKEAAIFRGGRCLAKGMEKGNLKSKLKWKCASGHEFKATPYLILKAGHWCPECLKPPWNFDEQAKQNPFFAQLWHIDHDPEELQYYS